MDRGPEVFAGGAPLSHRGDSEVGVVVLHGFTGTPSSVRGVADAMMAAGFHVELPRLPGHGTVIDDLLGTGWSDWLDETERAVASVRRRAERLVLFGQSMGATLALAAALGIPDLAGLVCVNPATRPRDEATMEMVDDFIDDGVEVAPGGRSDIADPDGHDDGYEGTPLRPLRSFVVDGIVPITDRFGELKMPLRLYTSRNDHVVEPTDSEHLAATYGGPVEHTWLERSYHVATLDHDRDLVFRGAVDFVGTVMS